MSEQFIQLFKIYLFIYLLLTVNVCLKQISHVSHVADVRNVKY